MSRRIDVELTSQRPDGTWTWRAAGAREPRGDLDGGLLPGGAKVGDVVRAEAEFDIEGITVISVSAPTTEEKPKFERLEMIGPQREFTPVTSTLVGRGDRDRGDRGDRRGPRRDRPDRPDRPGRDDRSGRPDRAGRPDRPGERPERRPRPEGERGERPAARGPRRERPAPPPPLPERPKPKRLRAGSAHRDELLGSLSPERKLIVEQLLKGGVPAVRTALDEQNKALRASGQPEVPTANVIQAAEDLMPAVRIADWLDKADAAVTDLEELSLADLRAVVTSAGDVAREERTKDLAQTLRDALDRRSKVEHEQWIGDVRLSMQHGRVVRALRLASRAPEPTLMLPDDLLTELATAAGAAMTSEIAPDRFATLLDAVAYSPVRRDVEPAGVPAEPGDELLAAVRKHAGRTPTIATRFGVEPPPPKERPGKGGRTRPPRQQASPADKPKPAGPPVDVGGRKIPPPPRPAAKSDTPEPDAAPVDASEADAAPAAATPAPPDVVESAAADVAPAESDTPEPGPGDLAPEGAPSAPGAETVEPEVAAPAPPDVVDSPAADVAPEEPPAAPTPIGTDVADDAAAESAGEEPDPEIQ